MPSHQPRVHGPRLAARLVSVLLVMAFCRTVRAQGSFAFLRARNLRRGINLSMWYAQDPELYDATGGAVQLATYITPDDFRLIHTLGFDHVRLSIDPEPLIADREEGTLRPEAMARLDYAVRQITAQRLVVVLDVHPGPAWKHDATRTAQGAKRFLKFWSSFAGHYARTDPDRVYFEILNEPDLDSTQWAHEQLRAVQVIRSRAPRHTIVATGADWGSLNGLRALQPLPYDNVIYSFHDYHPLEFTHQGANWAGSQLEPLRHVPYPSSPRAVAPLLPELTDPAAARALFVYGQQYWNIGTMTRELETVARWASLHDVPLWCGEFGVYDHYAPPAARARWIADMRLSLENAGIGWNMWDYCGNFALVSRATGRTVADPRLVEALGLR